MKDVRNEKERERKREREVEERNVFQERRFKWEPRCLLACFVLVSRHFVNDNVFKDENMGTEVHGYLSLHWRTILRIMVPRVFSRVFKRLFIFRNEEEKINGLIVGRFSRESLKIF